jgi:hypothetical protein
MYLEGEDSMAVNDRMIAALDAIAGQPLQRQLDFLLTLWTTGQVLKAPWDPEPAVWNQGMAQAYLQRLAIEQTARLATETSGLTKRLIALTWSLVALGAVGLITGWWFWAHPHS